MERGWFRRMAKLFIQQSSYCSCIEDGRKEIHGDSHITHLKISQSFYCLLKSLFGPLLSSYSKSLCKFFSHILLDFPRLGLDFNLPRLISFSTANHRRCCSRRLHYPTDSMLSCPRVLLYILSTPSPASLLCKAASKNPQRNLLRFISITWITKCL